MLHLFVLIFHDMLRVKDNNLFKFNLLPPTMIATGAFSCHLDHREAFIIFIEAWKILFSPTEISGRTCPALCRRTTNAKILKCNLSVVWTMRMFESNQVIFMSSQEEFFSAWDLTEQATRDSLVSFVREYSHHLCWVDRCDSKVSGYPFSLLMLSGFNIWCLVTDSINVITIDLADIEQTL